MTIWRIRLFLGILPLSLVTFIFSSYKTPLWYLFTAAWMAAFLYLYIFYYPIKYRKLFYSFNDSCILIHCGVIYSRIKTVPYVNIQYVSVSSTPLARLFQIFTLRIRSAGSSAYIPGLRYTEALSLQKILTPYQETGGDVLEA